MFDTDISLSVLTDITDRIIPDMKAMKNRPLHDWYCIVWWTRCITKYMGMEVRKQSHILWVNIDGCKEVIGMYVSESEGANFWMNVLAQIQYRSVKEYLRGWTDNLKEFSEAISSV